MNRGALPIHEIGDRLVSALQRQRRLIVCAPTGSGKSTQVPQMLLDSGRLGRGQVVVLQPRRLPARMLASWVARQRGVPLGGEVGYQIRLDNVTSPATRIRYVTEGILLRQMIADPQLAGVSAIIFDEFHERHLYGDITLARALQLQETTRPDLLLIVMSATLDVATVRAYLEPCATLESAGRAFPVSIAYLPKSPAATGEQEAIWEVAARELARLTREHPEGDALVFMPGGYEIARTVQAAREMLGGEFVVLPLHGELSAGQQDAALARYDRRKVVVATNVAETSLTIDGVRLVIDSGLARIPRYDPYRGINTLWIEKISRASADQRAGRAGRTAPGHCLRLWTEREHGQRRLQELPEVKRLELSEVVLTLKAAEISDVRGFRWLEPPERLALDRAETLLADLGAVRAATGAITETGRRMLAFPAHPRYARMMLAAQQFGCVRAVALLAALTQGRDLLTGRPEHATEQAREELFGGETASDLFVRMRAFHYAARHGFNVERCRRVGVHAQTARQAAALFEQFLRIAAEQGLDVAEKPAGPEAIQRCLLVGFSDHLARRLDAGTLRCELVHGRRGALARDSVARDAPLLVAAEVRELQTGTGAQRDLNVVLSLATAVRQEWLRELFPDDFCESQLVVYDPAQRRVLMERRTQFRDLTLESARSDQPPPEQAARLLAREVAAGRCRLKNWTEAVEQWILRVNRVGQWLPELGLPAIGAADRQAMLEQICHGATAYKEVKDRPVWPVARGWLSKPQQELVEQYAPERIELPGGRRAKITYAAEGPPTVSARIQDLYGVKQGLWIADRRVGLRIEILAPNNRPVQVTDNLAAFWRDTYPQLKQQLQRKYPKHQWR
jgi:ATP-dependent helicase HrpB